MNRPDDSIVRIYDSNSRAIGCGFLISKNLIITCAHVVRSASGTTNLGVLLSLDFPLIGDKKPLTGKVIFIDNDKDVACIEISALLPISVVPANLVIDDNLWGHTFRVFGFPHGYTNGVWSSGVLRGNTGDGWLQIEDVKDAGFNVQPGFSGGLVWDDQLQSVVGMIIASEMDRTIKAAFCIPTRGLINVYPVLKDYSVVLCPYRSLDVFTENDNDLFFGRERFVANMISRLKGRIHFLAILGPSGSGKSSVTRAGLIPALREGKVPGSERWHVMTIRPGVQPFIQLENVGLTNINSGLVSGVNSWLVNNPTKTRLVLFIDQFEELLIVTPRDIRKTFVAELFNLLNSSLPILVIITLRSDFQDRFTLEASQIFSEWMQEGLTPISSSLEIDELYAMIANPALKSGVEFEEGLINRIVKDAVEIDRAKEQAESTILPLLEFALTQMWNIKQGNIISHNDYQKIGEVSGGLSLWADKAYYDLNEVERKIARRILTDLVNFGNEASRTPNTKRIRQYDEIARNEIARIVMQKLIQARLLIAGYDISLKQNTVEIIHEALIYKWALLIKWIEEDREYLSIYNPFVESAKEWERLDKDDSLLYRGSRLSGLVNALENRKAEILSPLEHEFLDKSKYNNKLSILNETSSRVSSSLDLEEIYALTHKAAERLMPLESFVITLLDREEKEIGAVYLFDRGERYQGDSISLEKGLSSSVIESSKPILISSLEQLKKMSTLKIGEKDDEIQSIVAVPMISDGKAIGMLSAQSYKADMYTEEDVQILGALANQSIAAIQKGRLFVETQSLASIFEMRVVERTSQLQREQQNTETLLRILTETSSSLDLDRALTRTLSLLNDAIGAEQGTILLLHAEDNRLHYRAGYGYLSDQSAPGSSGFTLKVGEGLAGWVVQNRESVLVSDLRKDPRWVRNTASRQDHRSSIAVPMLVGEDVIGVLMVFQRAENFFSAEMLNLVKAIAGQVAVAINNAHLYELIRDQAERLGVMLRKEQEDSSRSQAILEAVADGVLVTGSDNRITFVNSSVQRILSVDEARLLGNPLDVFGGLFGKAASTWMETIRHWSKDPASYVEGDTYAEQLDLENGRIVLVHLAPVILQNDFLGTVSIFRDITYEVEVDRLKSEFVATISDELRTPMTAIKDNVDILAMGTAGTLNESQMNFLNIASSNIDHLNILINNMLDISGIEAGRVTLNPQSVDLHEIAEDIIADVLRHSQTDEKPMALSLDAPKKLPAVIGDGELVRQILGNLVDNAYNYTPNNGTIRVNIHQENGEVQVDVQDNGIGIASEDHARIFERFFRGEHPLVLATPGTGLGLPIVRQLVEMHKGRIWMTSTGVPGEGSTFSFTLPIYK